MSGRPAHPYDGLPAHRFWSSAIADENPADVDAMLDIPERISADHKVATMGSCFAQHISTYIANAGLCHFVTEQPEEAIDAEERRRRNFDVYSARYGNVYTPRQALQLFQRAFGTLEPVDRVWASGDRFVDAFRPRIEPDGFRSVDEVEKDAVRHLACVRRVFTESDWLVFTLGLTECWQSREDGAVYPLAPGVAGGVYDPDRYSFKNLSFQDAVGDLACFVDLVSGVNREIRIILTISPVPLVATYENRHVLSSTVCSKAVLRAAADEVERTFGNVIYFPSYEIVTSPASEGRYYADDLRNITGLGVDHVMRVFDKHFVRPAARDDAKRPRGVARRVAPRDVICDEEEIELAVSRHA